MRLKERKGAFQGSFTYETDEKIVNQLIAIVDYHSYIKNPAIAYETC